MLITRNLTSSCCFSEFSPQPELETWCRGLSGRSVTPESLSVAAHRQHLGGSERGDLVLDGLGSNPSSTTYNLWALEQVVQPYCASPLLPVKWVDVKVKHVNIRKGLRPVHAVEGSICCHNYYKSRAHGRLGAQFSSLQDFRASYFFPGSPALLQALLENFRLTF